MSLPISRNRPFKAVCAVLALLAGISLQAGTVLFHDDFGTTSRGELRTNVVGEPPPIGLGYQTTVPRGYALKNWIIADAEPEGPRRAFWVIPQRADGSTDSFAEQAGRSHDSIAFAGKPVSDTATHYVVEFRQWVHDNDYIGFVLGARSPVMRHDGIEFGYERQLPGTDETVPDIYYRGALGRGRIAGQARLRRWVNHRIEVQGQHVRWSQDGEIMLAGAVATLRPGGYFGIRQRYERSTRYDDVTITVLADAPFAKAGAHHVATISGATWNAEEERPVLPDGWSAVALLPGETNRVALLQWWTALPREEAARLCLASAVADEELRVIEALFAETGERAGVFRLNRAKSFQRHEIDLSAANARRAVQEGIRLRLTGGTKPFWILWRHASPNQETITLLPQIDQTRAERGPLVERAGHLTFEAEDFHHSSHPEAWREVPGVSGRAMKVLDGPWPRHLRYDLEFTTPGTYRLWLLARKNPDAPQYQGNDIKIFFYAAEAEQIVRPGHYPFEVGLKEQKEFLWVDWPKNSPSNTTEVQVPRAGRYSFYLTGGAGEEQGWEVDQVLFTRDNQRPPSGSKPEPVDRR